MEVVGIVAVSSVAVSVAAVSEGDGWAATEGNCGDRVAVG